MFGCFEFHPLAYRLYLVLYSDLFFGNCAIFVIYTGMLLLIGDRYPTVDVALYARC